MAATVSPWALAADLFDPPELPADRRSPAAFAHNYSRGMWRKARHLALVEKACLDTIATGGRLILSVSVRHGKSEYASRWLPAWFLATNPNKRVILAGHEADFASRHGRFARDVLTEYGHLFGVAVSRRSEAANRWDLERPNVGGMLTVGVGGSPIGRGADLMIVDDPIKSYQDAMSPLVRQRIKEWWTGTMVSRIEPGGAVIVICARWHEDDLSGFLLAEDGDQWTELRLPAICDDPANDPMHRYLGEPLWPERFPVDELERRHRETALLLGEQVWLAQYQQTPTKPKGGLFPEGRWTFAPAVSVDWRVEQWVRGWDLAATEDGGDWTVGALLGRLSDGRTVVADVRRGQWSSDRVREELVRAARDDPAGTRVELPQDPGQAGKDQAAQLTRLLSGYDVHSEAQTGSKEVRATGLSAQQRAGNVVLVEGGWNGTFVAECASFPTSRHDDQVDAAATAFNALHSSEPASVERYRDLRLRGRR